MTKWKCKECKGTECNVNNTVTDTKPRQGTYPSCYPEWIKVCEVCGCTGDCKK